MSTTSCPHISLDADGNARIGNTRFKAIHLAGEHFFYGWTAEELLRQHPDLRPEEVYSALTWFYDHYDAIVSQLKETAFHAESVRQSQSLSRAELLARNSGEMK